MLTLGLFMCQKNEFKTFNKIVLNSFMIIKLFYTLTDVLYLI